LYSTLSEKKIVVNNNFCAGIRILGQSQSACGGFAWGWILSNAGFNVDLMY